MRHDSVEVTQLLIAWGEGDEGAFEHLIPLVYEELRSQARRFLRKEREGHTLQTTALVHEAYFRLVDQKAVNWKNRSHFYGIAAQMMRRILVDHARRGAYAKRGGGEEPLPLDERIALKASAAELVALDDGLSDLATREPQLARLVELRYFGGLSNDELAEVLGISVPTITRRWRMAKAWLFAHLNEGASHGA